MPQPHRFRRLPVILCALAAAFVAAAAASIRTAPDTYPVADTATTSIATLQAARGARHVGAYSRFGWNHPGPLLYQVLAGPYELSGRREIALKWTALALNLAWLGGLLALAGRRSPRLAIGIAAALVPLLGREQRLLFSAWNPFVTVLALAFAVAAAADLATGRGWRTRLGLAWLAIALSFVVQAHAGLAVPSALCLLAAAVGLRRAATGPAPRPWTAIAVSVAFALAAVALLWATPLVAEMRERPGNLARLVPFLLDGELPRTPWPRAVQGAAYMTLGPFLPSWVLHFNEVPFETPAWLPAAFAAVIAATGACAIRLHRAGRSFDAAVATLASSLTVTVLVAARGIVGPLSDYLLLWGTAVGALDAAVIVATLLPAAAIPEPSRAAALARGGGLAVTVLLAWGLIGGLRLAGKHDEQARDTTVRALALDLQAYCDRAGIARPLLTFAGDTAWQEAAGVILQFDKRDRPIAVGDDAVYLVGRSFARTGREDATFFLMPTTGVALPAGTPRADWVTTRGLHRIVRVR